MTQTSDEQRKHAQDMADQAWPPCVGRMVERRIIALRIAAGDSPRLIAELDGLVLETLQRIRREEDGT